MDVNSSSSVQTSMEHETADREEPLRGMSLPDFIHDVVLLEYRLRTCLFAGSGLSHFVFDVLF